MKNLIILLLIVLGIQVAQAQSDTTQGNQSNQATQSDQITESDEATQSNDSTQNNETSPGTHSSSEGTDAAVTDEELEKYAVTMDSINDMKESLLGAITAKIKSNVKLTNARYNELSKIIDDEAALTKAKATPEETAFIKEVAALKEEGTAKIQETFQSMAKDYVGASAFNKIKKSLSADPELQKRYQTQMDKLGNDTDTQN